MCSLLSFLFLFRIYLTAAHYPDSFMTQPWCLLRESCEDFPTKGGLTCWFQSLRPAKPRNLGTDLLDFLRAHCPACEHQADMPCRLSAIPCSLALTILFHSVASACKGRQMGEEESK